VHASLSSLGWVCGGAVAVVQALMDAVTQAGTLVVPTFTTELTEPSLWRAPAVPESWWPVIRATMPAFDPRVSPPRHMGAIVETLRAFPGVERSTHPAVSFAAWGRAAARVLADHALDEPLGEGSPLARIYELDARVLLLGVGYDRCTSMHLAEHRAPHRRAITQGSPVLDPETGARVWRTWRDIELDDERFPTIGASLESAHPDAVRVGPVGSAVARLLPQRLAVDYALAWLTRDVPG
jgi:aminoglycoside 3-N-acetyltransferase